MYGEWMNNNWMELIILERANKVEQTFELNISSHRTPLKPEIALGEDRFRPFYVLIARKYSHLPSELWQDWLRAASFPSCGYRLTSSFRNKISKISSDDCLCIFWLRFDAVDASKCNSSALQVYDRISEIHSANKLQKRHRWTRPNSWMMIQRKKVKLKSYGKCTTKQKGTLHR